jgi:DNA polymerase III subunit epsilon
MRSLRDLTITVVDTETTGLKPETGARVIELALVRLAPGGEIIDTWSTLLNPGVQIPAETTAIHGLTDDDVAGAPSFADVADAVTARMRGCVVAGHNVGFDWNFLRNEYRLAGIDAPVVPLVDTLEGARRHLTGLSRHRLGMCCEHLGITLDGWHAALADTVATAHLLYQLIEMAERRGGGTVDDLAWFTEVAALADLPSVAVKDRPAAAVPLGS